ncbi:MAG: GntR family transcriptional regulator [Pleurocapsa minor GSE-CHR-MK-17-07R]|jgi:DNA-binding GntR family transcriptional regulator|nr:GntR family transcriptional regulator [Pleurocapsa minor GSE-CHR-MK 17-07R]
MTARTFAPIEEHRLTLAAQVQNRIREAILKQSLKPGTHIDQDKLREELQVSMSPIREALKGLEAEGLVVIQPRRGAFVMEVSVSDMDDLYFTRQLIEGEAIASAVPHLTDADFTRLEQMISEMRRATDRGDISTFIHLNKDFHLHIYNALDNQHLIQVIRTLWERSELYRYRLMFTTHNSDRIHREHAGILEACRQRDAALAKTRAQQHILLTQQELDTQLRGGTT